MPTDIADKIRHQFVQYPKREYPKGQILVFADENPSYIFYLVRGRVRKYDISYKGDEIIINVFQAGSFFPMSWAINGTQNNYFYKAETDVTFHLVPATEALQFIKENPDVALDLLSRLYRGLEGVYGRLVHLMSGSAYSRVRYELIIECQRFGSLRADNSYEIKLNEIDLAARCGLSRETVSREIKKLKSRGLLEISRSSMRVHNIAKLAAGLSKPIA